MGKPRLSLALFVVTIPFVALIGCQFISEGTIRGSGIVETETRAIDDFERVSVCCGMQLFLTQAEEISLEIEAEDNLLPKIVNRISGGRLMVEFDRSSSTSFNYRPTRPVRVTVSGPRITGVEVSGGGRVEAGNLSTETDFDLELSGGSQGALQNVTAEDFVADLSGGSELDMDELRAGWAKLDLSGGSRTQMDVFDGAILTAGLSGGASLTVASGEVGEQRLDLSGGSEYQAAGLLSETTDISAGGQATVWAERFLRADLSGSSTLEYYGAPEIDEELSGGSRLVPRGEK